MSSQDILRLSTANLKTLIQSATKSCRDALYICGVFYFHTACMVFDRNDPVLIEIFQRYHFSRHIGKEPEKKSRQNELLFLKIYIRFDFVFDSLDIGAFGVVVEVDDATPDPKSPTRYAMKLQDQVPIYRLELKILSQLNSNKIVRLKRGYFIKSNRFVNIFVTFFFFGLFRLKDRMAPSTVLAGMFILTYHTTAFVSF